MATEHKANLVDLEKDLSCSICTEVLYQPLTLIDCLHSFCGSCLKSWFSWQRGNVRSSHPYTCPSCRAAVLGVKPNAFVTSLLDDYLRANPDRQKSAEEKAEIAKAYKPGEPILLPVSGSRQGADNAGSRRAPDGAVGAHRPASHASRLQDRGSSASAQQIQQQQQMYLHQGSRDRRENYAGRRRRQGGESSSRHAADASSSAPESAASSGSGSGSSSSGSSSRRHRSNQPVQLQAQLHSEPLPVMAAAAAPAAAARRQIEHQSSLRSLLSAADIEISDIEIADIEEEIARLIVEEGLLDGIDLSVIGRAEEEAIRKRIDEASRRRQLGRFAPRGAGAPPPPRRGSEDSESARRARDTERRRRAHSRSHSASLQDGDRRRLPVATTATDLATAGRAERRRRRSDHAQSEADRTLGEPSRTQVSGSRRLGQQSAMDVAYRPRSSQASQAPHTRSVAHEDAGSGVASYEGGTAAGHRRDGPGRPSRARANSDATGSRARPDTSDSQPGLRAAPVAAAATTSTSTALHTTETRRRPAHEQPRPGRARRESATEAHSVQATASSDRQPVPVTGSGPARLRASLYAEPFVSCSRCQREGIQYELHYNCPSCDSGEFNLCLDCYRRGRGCKHWYGFGSAAWLEYERLSPAGGYPANHPLPHALTGHRYLRPAHPLVQPAAAGSDSSSSGGGNGGGGSRRLLPLLTSEDPQKRLQAGMFCSMCGAFANACWWKCDVCNDGEWGFCSRCVDTGHCCTHPLLPLVYLEARDAPLSPLSPNIDGAAATVPFSSTQTSPHDPSSPTTAMPPVTMHQQGQQQLLQQQQQCPSQAAAAATASAVSLLRGPMTVAHGPLKPLSIATSCNVCRLPIAPAAPRYHCAGCNDGDYDMCAPCYSKLCSSGRVSPENGSRGWRRCLRGHRMIVVEFRDEDGGRRRVVRRDLVGGLALRDTAEHTGGGGGGSGGASAGTGTGSGGSGGNVSGGSGIDSGGGGVGRSAAGHSWSWREGPDGHSERKVLPKIRLPTAAPDASTSTSTILTTTATDTTTTTTSAAAAVNSTASSSVPSASASASPSLSPSPVPTTRAAAAAAAATTSGTLTANGSNGVSSGGGGGGSSSSISGSSEAAAAAAPVHFPPDGGAGMRALALWGYFPAAGVADELLFPRGAELREVVDVNGDWFWGGYAGRTGLFPGPYVQLLEFVG